jgi:hypothetical protein
VPIEEEEKEEEDERLKFVETAYKTPVPSSHRTQAMSIVKSFN